MATFSLSTTYDSFDYSQYFPYGRPSGQGQFQEFPFDYDAPITNQDDSINLLKPGQLIYTTANGIKKVEIETTNATLIAPDVQIGFALLVYSDEGDTLFADGKQFTQDGGKIVCFVGKNIEVYTNKLTIHSRNGAGADTEVVLDPATHAAAAAVLENIIQVADKDASYPTIRFLRQEIK